MSQYKLIREMIREAILAESGVHRCMDGRIVSQDSEECYIDIGDRINDAMYQRDNCSGGTANRAYYNGVLADLRKKKRRLGKIYGTLTEKADRPSNPQTGDYYQRPRRSSVSPGTPGRGYKDKFEEEMKELKALHGAEVSAAAINPQSHSETIASPGIRNVRRRLKQLWRKYSHRSLHGLRVIHWFGWTAEARLSQGNNVDAAISYLDEHGFNSPNSDTMSGLGYRDRSTPEKKLAPTMMAIGVELRGAISFAAAGDIFSEEWTSADAAVEEEYEDSGIPRRPAPGTVNYWEHVLLHVDQLKKPYVDEVLVENARSVKIWISEELNRQKPELRARFQKRYPEIEVGICKTIA